MGITLGLVSILPRQLWKS